MAAAFLLVAQWLGLEDCVWQDRLPYPLKKWWRGLQILEVKLVPT
jgi:hypothetical protein